jgi:hypothetical protein
MQGAISQRFERVLGPLPGQREARAFSRVALAGAAVACAVTLYFGLRGEAFMGRPMGNDFVQFYAAGKVLNQQEPARIYDVRLMARVEQESLPTLPRTQILVYGNAPFLAQLFRPFAKLSYPWAYCAWLVFSLMLYGGSLWLLLRNWFPDDYARTAFLLALSAPIYTMETWIGGQISVLAFLTVVGFVRCFAARSYFLAGFVLGLAAYKPSLLALPAAIMLLAGAWRMLGGLCLSASVTLLASLATVGAQGLDLWFRILKVYSFLATQPNSVLRRTKYVDLNSFFTLLLGGGSLARIVTLTVTAAAFIILARAWWKSRNQPPANRGYLWATTFSWTLLLNVYVPIYDTIILIPAVALAAHFLIRRDPERQPELQAWLVALWLLPWLTQAFADALRLQIFTMLLAGFGYWALTLARGNSLAAGDKDKDKESLLALQGRDA